MTIDAEMYVKPAAWDAIDPVGLSESTRTMYEGAIIGFWDQFVGGFTVYNVIGSQINIDELKALIAPADLHSTQVWVQGPGFDNIDSSGNFETTPAEVLAVMKDHKTYDEDGNETSSTPATFANPNWGHVFLGQKERIFAGQVSDAFSQEFL